MVSETYDLSFGESKAEALWVGVLSNKGRSNIDMVPIAIKKKQKKNQNMENMVKVRNQAEQGGTHL